MKKESIKLAVGDKLLAVKGFRTWYDGGLDVSVSAGSVIEFMGIEVKNYPSGYVARNHVFKNLSNGKLFVHLEPSKVIPYKDGDEIPDFKNVLAYKIKYNGKFLKPKKFKDLGQVKVSLLIAFGYYDKLRNNADKVKNPELYNMEIPYWFEGREEISLEEFRNVEIVSVTGKVEAPVEFNAYEYIKESEIKLGAICKYGSVAKEMFTKVKDEPEYKYFITITPDKYKEVEGAKWSYRILEQLEELKENPIVKETIKNLGLKTKDFKKVTKMGKTAIAVKEEENLFRLMDAFYDLNIDVFATENAVREYSKEARRKQIINNL